MSFNSTIVKNYAGGVTAAFAAPWASYKGSVIALSGVVATTVTSTAGLVLQVGGTNNIEFESLIANVQSVLTTASLTVTGVWQGSNDGTNWANIYGLNGTANTITGTAGATTTWYQAFAGVNPSLPYVRFAVINNVATGGASDNVTVSYNWRKRFNPTP